MTLADPGFGQGGPRNFARDFVNVEAKLGHQKQANIGLGPSPAFGPWKLLHI